MHTYAQLLYSFNFAQGIDQAIGRYLLFQAYAKMITRCIFFGGLHINLTVILTIFFYDLKGPIKIAFVG